MPSPASRPRVVIADCNFASTETERRELAAIDAEVSVGQCSTEDAVIDLCADADGVIVQYAPITRRVLSQLRKCRIVSRYGIGLDNIDVPAATERGIWVGHAPGFCTVEVAEHTLAMVFACARRLFVLDELVHHGGWDTIGPMAGGRLADQTLGLVGFGNIGRAVAERARALGMRVLAFSPHTTPELAARHGAERVELAELFSSSDYVSLHCPLAPQTRHLVDAAALARMKPGAFVINTSRGALVDQPALVAALRSSRLAGAALDVLEFEPIPAGDPLLGMRNVILTPHSAYYSARAQEELQARTARNVVQVLRGEPPLSPANRIGG